MSERVGTTETGFWADTNEDLALQRYQTLVNTLDDGLYQLDADGHFVAVNDPIVETTGYARKDLLGAHVSLILDDADIDRVEREIRSLIEMDQDDVSTLELPVRTAGGDTIFCELRLSLLEVDGEFDGTVGVARDITDRKRRERTLEHERELERALDLLDKTERIADVGGWEIDMDTMEVFWTDYIFDLLEVTSEEEPSLDKALDMYYEDDRQVVEDAIENALDSGNPFDVEARIRTRSGEVRWLRIQGVPETVDDDAISLRGAAQDVTERKEREQQLEELVEQLEESNERLEQFAYAASHDLQEPLRMVSSYLQLIERRYDDELDEDGQEFLEFAVDGADRMREMINGLLEYARVETQGDPFEPVDLNSMLEDVRTDLQLQIGQSNAEIAIESLPSVQGDAGQLQQVFQNLLSNAIEYSGDEPPRVHIAAEQTGTKWTVSVSDEGIGVDPDDADRIFEVFQSLHSPGEHDGTGIGLALSERIVERHNGDIWVESGPGEGATFSFTLPAVLENERDRDE